MLRPRWVYGACPKRRLHYRACPYRQQASALVSAEERRIAKDGKAYRLGEFLHHYGQELGSVMWDYGLPHNPVAATEKFKAVVLAYEALAALNEADAVSMFNGNSSWKGVCVQCGTASVDCKGGDGPYSGLFYCPPCWVAWDGGAPPEDHGGPTKLNDTATEQAADA